MFGFGKKKTLDDLNRSMPREELLRRSRVLVIDDERPDIVDDLKSAGFAVDYEPDIDTSKFGLIDKQRYDLVLLDFGNVGKAFGTDEGLSLLRHIKRVNPAIVVLTYTSKSLGSSQADFYRLSDGVLAKDAGISESLEKIEDGLRKAHSVPNVWNSLLAVCNVRPGSKEDQEWQDLLVKGVGNEAKMNQLKGSVVKFLTSEEGQKTGMLLLQKLMGLAATGGAGG